MKRLILIRHGQTQKGKNEPERTLTLEGEDRIAEAADKLYPYILGPVIILYSPTLRTRQSAIIIGEVLDCENIWSADLRMIGPELIASRANAGSLLGIPAAAVYMQKMHDQPVQIETPEQLVNRFNEIFNSYAEDTVIAVSHEPALNTFIKSIKGFNTVFKSFDRSFDYADFIILEKE